MIKCNSYQSILTNLYDGLYLVDLDRSIIFWNIAAELITGFSSSDVIGKRCSDNILTHVDEQGINLCKGMCPLAKTIQDNQTREAEVYLHHKNGHRVPVSVRISALTDSEGNTIGGIELFSDISRYKSIEQKMKELESMALLDNLTHLANRNYLEKEMEIKFEEKKRLGISFGIFFIDIDDFKKINDTHGHDVGDKVLKFVANTLTRNSRPFDIVGRWGGEEFVIIVSNATASFLESFGNRLRVLVEASYILNKNEKLRVTISMGATFRYTLTGGLIIRNRMRPALRSSSNLPVT